MRDSDMIKKFCWIKEVKVGSRTDPHNIGN